MSDYQQARDREAMPVYEFTDEFAQLQPPPPEMQQLIGAMHGNQEAMDGFISVQASTLPAPEFFAPENVGRDHGGGRSCELTVARTSKREAEPVARAGPGDGASRTRTGDLLGAMRGARGGRSAGSSAW